MKIFDLSEENLLEVFNQAKNLFEERKEISFRLIYIENFFEAKRFLKENFGNVHSVQGEEMSGYVMSQIDPHMILPNSFFVEGGNIVFEDHNNNRRMMSRGDTISFGENCIFHSRKIKNKIFWEVWVL